MLSHEHNMRLFILSVLAIIGLNTCKLHLNVETLPPLLSGNGKTLHNSITPFAFLTSASIVHLILKRLHLMPQTLYFDFILSV